VFASAPPSSPFLLFPLIPVLSATLAQNEPTAAEAKANKRARAAEYAASLNAQIAKKDLEKENDTDGHELGMSDKE